MNASRNQSVSRRGFTLIELLVVVAIIALLAALLLPALKQARLRGKIAVCMSNMRQLGIGWYLYADSNGGYIPGNYQECGYDCRGPGIGPYYEGIQVWMDNVATGVSSLILMRFQDETKCGTVAHGKTTPD